MFELVAESLVEEIGRGVLVLPQVPLTEIIVMAVRRADERRVETAGRHHRGEQLVYLM
jgi:hypothetical protein